MMKKMNDSRLKFISKYDLKMKSEFWANANIVFEKEDFKIGQVVPILQNFEELNIYTTRDKLSEARKHENHDCKGHEEKVHEISHLKDWNEWNRDIENQYQLDGDLSIIKEQEDEDDLLDEIKTKMSKKILNMVKQGKLKQ